MKAKLIKMVEGYTLSLTGNIDDLYGISNQQLAEDHQLYKLSLKNCEAVERGYDLEELACDEIGIDISVIKHVDRKVFENDSVSTPIHEAGALGAGLYHQVKGFEIGFKKALEILGDKKFNEDDVKKAILLSMKYNDIGVIQSLQQNEWDVEIVMDRDCYSSAGRCDKLTMADCIICTPVTYLKDADGCLILKRI